MGTGLIYYDSEGNECDIQQLKKENAELREEIACEERRFNELTDSFAVTTKDRDELAHQIQNLESDVRKSMQYRDDAIELTNLIEELQEELESKERRFVRVTDSFAVVLAERDKLRTQQLERPLDESIVRNNTRTLNEVLRCAKEFVDNVQVGELLYDEDEHFLAALLVAVNCATK